MLLRNVDLFNDVLGLKNLIDNYFDGVETAKSGNYPLVNLREQGDRILVEMLVPGVTVQDISLELKDHHLLVTVTRKNDNDNAAYIRRERSFGTFSKSIRIPFRVNPDSINAELKNGILTVSLDKSEEAKSRTIQIR